MNQNKVLKTEMHELNLEEIDIISGGVEYSCTVSVSSNGTKTLTCTIKGNIK
ncbi:hypothetical protein [Janthinobacterium agaricidamnosum]|uniref:Uncharacterized protein n=1 Tax=Janthinobacterium agaricidamnosum NBRC 102515 = DSM 9628 TaxID=1349767 RepID=W0VDN7_9BURK|nr:hypothetical protein [Janthinobacterium agaricidamnosum]CDG85483.1 hypothetical protein GJA_4879 [Janthinobacterium agaricidamnosum NBRC 102515 = DSM 9628]